MTTKLVQSVTVKRPPCLTLDTTSPQARPQFLGTDRRHAWLSYVQLKMIFFHFPVNAFPENNRVWREHACCAIMRSLRKSTTTRRTRP